MSSKVFIGLATIVTAAILAASCDNPTLDVGVTPTNLNAPGTMRVLIADPGDEDDGDTQGYAASLDAYEVMLSGIQSLGPIITSDPELIIEDLPLGEYTVSVNALDRDGRVLAAGSASGIELIAGAVPDVEVVPRPVMGGEGQLALEWTWPRSVGFEAVDDAIVTLTPKGAGSTILEVEWTDDGLSYDGSAPSGEYEIRVELFRDETLVYQMSETVVLYDGLETGIRRVLTPDRISLPPSAPGDLSAEVRGADLRLRWSDDSDNETSYRVYRREDERDFVLLSDGLPADSRSWVDRPVEPGRTYEYAVAAVNDFGESRSEGISVTVDPPVMPTGEAASEFSVPAGAVSHPISVASLLEGYVNRYNGAPLSIGEVRIAGGSGSARIEGDLCYIDLSPDGSDDDIVLEYRIYISGQPRNTAFSALGRAILSPESPPETDRSRMRGYVYADRDAFERRLRLFEPWDSEAAAQTWPRISNSGYFDDRTDALQSKQRGGDDADQARHWRTQGDGDRRSLVYGRNSVYAGLLCPDGDEREVFSLEATLSSNDSDDDTMGLVIAFVREGATSYVLEAARSHGATSGERSIEPAAGWGLVVRRLRPDDEAPEIGTVLWSSQAAVAGVRSDGWKRAESRIRAVRDRDSVVIEASAWNAANRYAPESRIEVDLNADPALRRFLGPKKYGLFSASQQRAAFTDIVLDTGIDEDRLFYVDPDTGESEVWVFDADSRLWRQIWEARIQDVVGYPVRIENPDTGRAFDLDRREIRRVGSGP